jgi:predicted metallopeptidase
VGVTYSDAPDVTAIGKDLIETHHNHLLVVRVFFVFRSKAKKHGDQEVWGTARKLSGLVSFLATGITQDLFLIEIAEDVWEYLDDKTKVALVDHELCHCNVEDDPEKGLILSTRPHDLEEFNEIVVRHGAWRENVRSFIEVGAVQLELMGAETK